MLVYCGIDEAGYGPMFGPLCVGASVFVMPDYDPSSGAPDLWSILDPIVCRKRRDRKHRIAVNDSKKLKSSSNIKGLFHLERGVLAFMCALGDELPLTIDNDTTDSDYFNALECSTTSVPWLDSTTRLPVAVDMLELRIDAARLRRVLDEANVQCNWLSCTSIDASTYNERTAIESKAALNLSTTLRLVDAIVHRLPKSHPRIMIDRHGGRIHYRNDLQQYWPEAHIQILSETASMSRYKLQLDTSQVTISFASKSDETHLPVALASMIAKYTRELQMIRFNRYFQNLIPTIKPTAGYVQDGRRFLKEIEPLLAKKGINRELLVRSS